MLCVFHCDFSIQPLVLYHILVFQVHAEEKSSEGTAHMTEQPVISLIGLIDSDWLSHIK